MENNNFKNNQEENENLDSALEDTFPASDPVASQSSLRPSAPSTEVDGKRAKFVSDTTDAIAQVEPETSGYSGYIGVILLIAILALVFW